jgi:hypothetical protein
MREKTLRIDPRWWSDHVWPIGITIALLIVVAVNAAFIVVAVSGQDPVVESYETGER